MSVIYEEKRKRSEILVSSSFFIKIKKIKNEIRIKYLAKQIRIGSCNSFCIEINIMRGKCYSSD